MKHQKLITFLENYGSISDIEKQNIKKYFVPLTVKKGQTLIAKDSPCNYLFFVNSGYLRAFYTSENLKEITRMIAWENRFLTNMVSFKNFTQNNETIECIKNAEILSIKRDDFNELMKSSTNLKSMYADILEEYTALHIRRFEVLNTFDLTKKLQHLKHEFPNLIKELNDRLLASFIGISRIHFVNNKHSLHIKLTKHKDK